MKFRAKQPAAFVAELSTLVERHQTLDVMMVDNIIDSSYFTSVLPALRDLDGDLRLHYEVKANLRREQIDALRSAGVVNIQPGIESLVTSILKRMDKGVSAVHNARTLRDCESAGLTVSWNWLVGFPGELDDDYAEVLQQLPALVHLQPPVDAFRIVVERFSPYFENPDLGFSDRSPASFYRHVYDLPDDILDDLVYMFDTEPRGLSGEALKELRATIAQWRGSYQDSSLMRWFDQSVIHIRDRRSGWPEQDYRISDPRFVAAYLLLEDGHSVAGLARRLGEDGVVIDPDELSEWLAGLHEVGLTFVEAGRHIALPTADVWVKLS
jgi:ribosomal peptide maturation radical SAM protein 1